MRYLWLWLAGACVMCACDETRLYEENHDFNDRSWLVQEKPQFEFRINDTTASYNVYMNLRNSVAFPYTRLFATYSLTDSVGNTLKTELVTQDLFDRKTGEPFGSSALGDLFDQRIPLLQSYTFPRAGLYKLSFVQMMRTDTLQGVLAVGYRVERAQ
jgi:gliding motility-associated lipoprotein GldH